MNRTSAAAVMLMAASLAMVGGDAPMPPPLRRLFSGEMTRRDKIEALKARTGWKHCRCRELVDTASEAEIEALVAAEVEAREADPAVVVAPSDMTPEDAVAWVRGESARAVVVVKP